MKHLATPRSKWKYSSYFAMVDTAHEWGKRPSELGLCKPAEDLAVMQVYTDTVARMRSQENLQAQHVRNRR